MINWSVLIMSLIILLVIVGGQPMKVVKADSQQDEADRVLGQAHRLRVEFNEIFTKLHECNNSENITKCKMDVMGWNDTEAAVALGLKNKSK